MKSMTETNWRITHNMSSTRIYRIYYSMKSRCYNKNHIAYHRYGGRGIKICDDWKDDFTKFYSWAIDNGYTDALSIDRVDNDGNYCPENCRWVALQSDAQQLGRKGSRYISFNGETKQLCEWAKQYGIKPTTLRERLRRGWTMQEALSTSATNRKQLHPNQPKHRAHWHFIKMDGEKISLAEAGRRYNVDPKKLRKLIVNGVPPKDAIQKLI